MGYVSPAMAAQWERRRVQAKEWVGLHGRYPGHKISADKLELSVYAWLYYNLPEQKSWRPERWDKLNETFGEGWGKAFCPGLGTGTRRCNEP